MYKYKTLIWLLFFMGTSFSCQTDSRGKENAISMNVLKENECRVVVDDVMQVGEGAIWDYKFHRLLWIDTQGKLMIYTPLDGTNRVIKLDRMIGTVVPYKQDTVLVGLADGIYEMDLISERLTLIADPEGRDLGNRYNDGKCDSMGRLWIGTMDANCTPKKANFFKVNCDGSSEKILDSVTISNGVIWSPDGMKMYYHDSPTAKITAFDFNVKDGSVMNRKEIVSLAENMGTPDGNCMDEEGMLWVANWGAACVTRWNPQTGELLSKIDVPALNVSSVAFGGEDMDLLFITTASLYMPEDKGKDYPDAGKLFVVKPGVKGLKSNYWKCGQ